MSDYASSDEDEAPALVVAAEVAPPQQSTASSAGAAADAACGDPAAAPERADPPCEDAPVLPTSSSSSSSLAPAADAREPVPLTVITGALGSGKTTLLNHILTGDHGLRIAVILNEFGEEKFGGGIERPATSEDASGGPEDGGGAAANVYDEWVELHNGCLCCTVRDQGLDALEKLVARTGYDYILIETTGMAAPAPIVSAFWADEGLGSAVRLDAVVTVVDAKYCISQIDATRSEGAVNENLQQIATADVVIVNKCDLVDAAALAAVEARVASINTSARTVRATRSRVELASILNIGAFDTASAARVEAVLRDSGEADGGGGGGQGPGHGHGHTHDTTVASVGISIPGRLSRERFEDWLQDALWKHGLAERAMRFKAVLAFERTQSKFVLQGLHDLYDIVESREQWGDADTIESRLVFIGRSLDRESLVRGIESHCRMCE
jgi:G3E family GTPase